MENRLNVGITHGDVNGISYELIIKLLAENRICELCVPILYGSPKVAAYYRKVLNIENFSLNTIREPGEANGKRSNIINCVDDNVKVDLGKETPESDQATMIALKYALDPVSYTHLDVYKRQLPLLLRWLTAGVSLPRMFVGPVGFVPFRLDFL